MYMGMSPMFSFTRIVRNLKSHSQLPSVGLTLLISIKLNVILYAFMKALNNVIYDGSSDPTVS